MRSGRSPFAVDTASPFLGILLDDGPPTIISSPHSSSAQESWVTRSPPVPEKQGSASRPELRRTALPWGAHCAWGRDSAWSPPRTDFRVRSPGPRPGWRRVRNSRFPSHPRARPGRYLPRAKFASDPHLPERRSRTPPRGCPRLRYTPANGCQGTGEDRPRDRWATQVWPPERACRHRWLAWPICRRPWAPIGGDRRGIARHSTTAARKACREFRRLL